jgi:hypothetical protein
VGIETIENKEKLAIIPNPASHTLHISSPTKQATLTTLTGQTLLTIPLKNGEAQVDVSNLAEGIYFLKTNEGRAVKVVVEH